MSEKQEIQGKHWLRSSILFFLGWVFMYADRTILSPVQHLIGAEFNLSNAEIGLISSLFFLIYTITQVPSGLLGDRFGRTKIILFGFVVFGLCTALTGLVQSFGMLLIIRAVAGFGEGFYYGPQYAITIDSTPSSHRVLACAIINCGQAVGITLGLVGSSWLCHELGWGWRSVFVIYALPTLLCGALIYMLVREGVRAPEVSGQRTVSVDLMRVLKDRCLMSIFFIEFCSVYGFFVMVTWLPQYLVDARGFNFEAAGSLSSLVAWTSIPAALLVARLSDKLKSRKPLLVTLLPLAVLSIVFLMKTTSATWVVVALVAYGIVGKLTADPLILALISDNAPKEYLSTVYGIYNCIAMAGAILAPYITGALRDYSHSFNSGFVFAIVLLIIGWLVACFVMHPKAPK